MEIKDKSTVNNKIILVTTKKEFDKTVNIKVRSTGRLLKARINLSNSFANVEILDKETNKKKYVSNKIIHIAVF